MNEETEPSISRSVVVTGASRGIGEAVTKAFLAQGDRVAGISRSGEAPDGALALAADVTDPDALAAALAAATEAHGPIEVLVASAGINRESLAARTSSQMWDEVISADLTGTFNTVRAVTPAMMRARKGRIVLVSSAIAARGGVGLSAYGAAKGGVEGLTRSLARELAPRGITVNAVAPGFVTTAMTASLPDTSAPPTSSRSPWDASPTSPTSPAPSSSWPHPRPPTSPARSSASTAAWAWGARRAAGRETSSGPYPSSAAVP